MKRIAVISIVVSLLVALGFMVAWAVWPRPSVAVIMDGVYTNAHGETRPWLLVTNPLSRAIKYQILPKEVKSDAGWSKSEGPKMFSSTGKPYETGLIFGGEILEPRSGFRFIAGDPTDQRPYRYPILWSLPPEIAAARPKWKRTFDEVTMRWRGRPTFVAYGIVRSPAIVPQLPNPIADLCVRHEGMNGRAMLSDKDTAAEVERTMRECSAALNESIRRVMETCPEDEFKAYRRAIGQIMGAIYLDVLQPIYRQYPDVEPEEMRHRPSL